ncbi:hypothetical protein H2200_001378 [Cladophialophora chaetospira]|uniref:Uncharacterized protein n=1 Tax=Cladophialophora chaetospira TaxID=386627 RepID=A0AA38XKW5_9EURO|nr:hypothetical protein H2200_001378 [Cladophialophora chaetospira]
MKAAKAPKFFLSRRWKPNKWPFYVLIGIELPLTVALLALFGIASPDTYRTRLWQDGADNGFNSSPTTGLYAAANYRPYTTPRVWSQFITDYNVAIVVLSLFIMLVKSIMYMLHVFPPILSVVIHIGLTIIYAVSVDYQASNDTTDPDHPQHGAPWYITKKCSVAHDKNNVHYCTQAKAAFACTCAMLGIFVTYLGFALYSCVPTRQQREEYAEKQRLKAERWAKFETYQDEETGETNTSRFPVPETPGIQTLNPMTPRTMAFNTLGGTKDLPLRTHFSSPNPTSTSPPLAIRSPDIPRSPMSPGFIGRIGADKSNGKAPEIEHFSPQNGATPQLYFPPPPKTSKK